MFPESSFDKLLNLVEMNHQVACDLEVGGCGKLNHIHHFLSTPPHVFMTGISVVACGISLFLCMLFSASLLCVWFSQFWVGKRHVRVLMI